LEGFFLVVYIVELCLRVFAVGWRVFGSHWVKFDALLVCCGSIEACVKLALAGRSASVLDKIMIMRILRVIRLVRAARVVVQFQALWLLVQGLVASCIPMFWVFVTMVALIYIFGILGLELIRTEQFSDLGTAMLTLTQFMFLDGGLQDYAGLMERRPALTIYFFAFILIGSVSLMNLVTAIMVESSLRQAREDREAQKAWEHLKKKELVPYLMELFQALDRTQRKELSLDDFQQAPDDVQQELFRMCRLDHANEIFEMLDWDDNGAVDIQEFCDGIMRVQGNTQVEIMQLLKQTDRCLSYCKGIHGILTKKETVRPSTRSHLPFLQDPDVS
jgi:voltage-gated sodium channel